MLVETARLALCAFEVDDVDRLTELDGDPVVMQFITGGRTTPRSEIEDEVLPVFLSYYERFESYGFWAAIRKGVAGLCGLVSPTPSAGGA